MLFILISSLFVFAQVDPRVDRFFKDYTGNVAGASALVIHNGQVLHSNSYGMANMESDTEMASNSNFRLASVTKQFTAMAAVTLIDKGLIQLDTKLKDIFPDWPHYARRINVRHLLTHTSGLRKYERNVPGGLNRQLRDADVLDIVKRLGSLRFSPGSQYKYSNTGYAILALLVERVSGQSFTQYLRDEIFGPLGMRSAVAHVEGETQVENRVYGYSPTRSGFRRTDQNIFSAVLGDGGIYMSTDDYYLWDQALYTDKLVPRALISQIFTRARLNNGNRVGYGFGWRIDWSHGMRRHHHTGSSVGFRNLVYRFPDKQFTVVILTNRNGPYPKGIANKIVQLYKDTL